MLSRPPASRVTSVNVASIFRIRLKAIDAQRLEITSNGGANFTTNRNLATLSGSAPIAAATLQINDVDFP